MDYCEDLNSNKLSKSIPIKKPNKIIKEVNNFIDQYSLTQNLDRLLPVLQATKTSNGRQIARKAGMFMIF